MLVYQIIVTLLLLNFALLVVRNLRDYVRLAPDACPPRPEERLFVLIPARNEAANIGECLRGLLATAEPTCPLALTFLVLDDGSDDGTDAIVADIAAQDGRVHLMRGEPITPGWAGKVWACRQLGEAALEQGADWLLFLDADTRSRPELLPASLAHAQITNAGMVSTFPYQETHSFWERVVLPMLHFLIITFLPVRMVWESQFPQLVAACGQFELFSAEAYRAVGGHGSIPRSFHDGLQLARRVKAAGRAVRLCDGSQLISCHMYAGGRAVWNGFTRNAYEGLGGIGPLVVMSGLQIGLFLLPFGWLAWSLIGGDGRQGISPLGLAVRRSGRLDCAHTVAAGAAVRAWRGRVAAPAFGSGACHDSVGVPVEDAPQVSRRLERPPLLVMLPDGRNKQRSRCVWTTIVAHNQHCCFARRVRLAQEHCTARRAT